MPRTFPVSAPAPPLRRCTPSCKPLGMLATAVLGEAVKAEPRGDNKASREEISRDQTRCGSHPTLDSQRSLCSRCLLTQHRAAFKGCGGDSWAPGQPCLQPLAVGQPPARPAIKKGGLIPVTGLIPAAHRGLIRYLAGSYQPGNKTITGVGDEGRDTRFPPHPGLACRGDVPPALLSPDLLSAPQQPHSLA